MAQAKPPTTNHDHHPVVAALHERDPWAPRPFTRTISVVSRGTRAIAQQVNPREAQWRDISRAAIAGSLPLWVVLGDSIAQGVGASSLSRSWVARIAGALEADGRPHGIVNLSRSGARAVHVRHHQLPLLDHLERDPALVTCGIGSNDLMRNPHPPSVSARVNELIDDLPDNTVVSTLPAPAASPSGRWVNRSVRRSAESRNLAVADVVPHLVKGRKAWASDRFHPSDDGYGAWVAAYCEALELDPATIPDEWDPRPS